jgi:hypothetical protein
MKTISKIGSDTIALLKKHGFKWFQDNTTDTVEANFIADIIPAAKGFTVVYDKSSALVMSTADVIKVEVPDDLDTQWIFVYWKTITDERRIP